MPELAGARQLWKLAWLSRDQEGRTGPHGEEVAVLLRCCCDRAGSAGGARAERDLGGAVQKPLAVSIESSAIGRSPMSRGLPGRLDHLNSLEGLLEFR